MDQNVSAGIQAITGIAALIIALVTAFQSRKIKELTDVTDAIIKQNNELKLQTTELKNQTSLMKQSFDMNAHLAMESRIPVFQHVQLDVQQGNHMLNFFIRNIGRDAFNINCAGQEGVLRNIQYEIKCKHKYDLGISAFLEPGLDLAKTRVIILVEFYNNYGHHSTQTILKPTNSLDFFITPPTEPMLQTPLSDLEKLSKLI